jgi:beta-glucuronidase
VAHLSLRAVSLALVLAALGAATATAATPQAGRELYSDGIAGKLLLDADWEINQDREAGGAWSPVQVPHSANAGDLSPAGFAGSVVWYRARFTMPAGTARSAWRVRFESVSERAEVFVNAAPAGSHEGAHLPFELDAPLRDGENEIRVRVDYRRDAAGVPGSRAFWWNWGGILREVYLREVDRIDLADVWARAVPRCRPGRCSARVSVGARLRNLTGDPQTVSLAAEIGGRPVPFAAVTLAPGETRTATTRTTIGRAKLWSPRNPALYRLAVTAAVGDTRVALWGSRFGVRELSVRRGHLMLNDKRLRLYGASVHEESPLDSGGALSDGQRRRDQKLFERLGAAVIRSHYPLHPSMLEWADRKGVLVWDEVPVFRATGPDLSGGAYREAALARLREAITRDRTHASVLAFSIGNEPMRPFTADGTDAYVREAARTVKELAPGSLAAMALLGYERPRRSFRELDLVGFNLYTGWYGNRTAKDIAPRLEQIRASWPRQATMISEFGAEANRGGPATEKGTRAFQARLLGDSVAAYASDRHLSGAIVWILRDFACAPDWAGGNPKPAPPWNFKGVATAAGDPKPAFGVLAKAFERLNRTQEVAASSPARHRRHLRDRGTASAPAAGRDPARRRTADDLNHSRRETPTRALFRS